MKIELIVGQTVKLNKIPEHFIPIIRRPLIIENPKWLENDKHNRSQYKTPKKLRFISEDSKIVPRGFLRELKKLLIEAKIDYKVRYHTKSIPIAIKSCICFDEKPHQPIAISKVLKRRTGVLQAPTGSGKTVMAIELICVRKERTLIVVHTKELLYQWKERLLQFTDLKEDEIGMLGDGKKTSGKVTIGIINTLRSLTKKNRKYFNKSFGFVIVDECFVADTLIDNKPIQYIKPGDMVYSYNHKTNKVEKKRVLRTFKSKPSSLCTVKIKNTKHITCTEGHPFYTKEKKYLTSKELNSNIGNTMLSIDYHLIKSRRIKKTKNHRPEKRKETHWNEMESIEIHKRGNNGSFGEMCEDGYVYNIEVEDNHNYFANGILVHNCHRIPSSTFTDFLIRLDVLYMLGLSATPYRRDGLDAVIKFYIGDIIHKIKTKTLQKQGHILKAKLKMITTKFSPYIDERLSTSINYKSVTKAIPNDEARNNLINHYIYLQAMKNEGTILVVSERIEHCYNLYNNISDNYNSAILTGTTKKKLRQQIMEEVNNKKIDILVATGQLVGEGLDIKHLSSVFLTWPIKYEGKLTQIIGRILRTADGKKEALIYDFNDPIYLLRGAYNARKKYYKEQGIIPNK